MKPPAPDRVAAACARAAGVGAAELVQTHASWVILAGSRAWKFKKQAASVARGRRLCLRELLLNRAIAPQVYREVVPVFAAADGALELGAGGTPLLWLLEMQRLPADRTLEARLQAGKLDAAALDDAARCLAAFHRRGPAMQCSAAARVSHARAAMRADFRALRRPRYRLPQAVLASLFRRLMQQLRSLAPLIAQRVADGHLIEGHGDLRAAHVYLVKPVQIIDRLDFSAMLRQVDGADEASFLALECERLGSRRAARKFLDSYFRERQDRVPPRLVALYQSLRACTRARLALAHLDEARYRGQRRWREQGLAYLGLALRLQGLAVEAGENGGHGRNRRKQCRFSWTAPLDPQ